MITRLKVRGFKNLQAVDVRFGPFTCIVGRNGVGKSNLFDALLFLGALANQTLLEAATSVRGSDPLINLFSPKTQSMSFEVEFLAPREGLDELGQQARASATFLRYGLELDYVAPTKANPRDNLRIRTENLGYIVKSDAAHSLGFPHSVAWRNSVVDGARRTPYISTDLQKRVVSLHQDRTNDNKRGGRPWAFPVETLPRTVLSSATNAQENPTAVLARQALRSCTLLQLEPSALRSSDAFQDPAHLSPQGRYLPNTLQRIAQADDDKARVVTQVANRLAGLVEDVDSVRVETNDQKRIHTVVLKDLKGQELSASSLSDGTLRFLALSVLELDPERSGVLCLEEPENGIHPERLPAMMELLQDIAVDVQEKSAPDNPLQQVLINTHSPIVLGLVPKDTVLFARGGKGGLMFLPLSNTWRQTEEGRTVALGDVLAYLNPILRNQYGYTPSKGSVAAEVPGQLELRY
jgi:predicted ATPase